MTQIKNDLDHVILPLRIDSGEDSSKECQELKNKGKERGGGIGGSRRVAALKHQVK